MARTLPFHSAGKGTPQIFHSNDRCYLGRNITAVNWRPGAPAGLRHCPECMRLTAQDRPAARSG
jgi:hypothetical protein